MMLRRFFERARTRSSETCLCTTAKRDSLYDDLSNEQQSDDQYGFVRTEKPRRLIRQGNQDESDGDDDIGVNEKLRRASSQFPANIPMLVVVSFIPDSKGIQKKQIQIHRGFPVNAQFILNEWLFVKTADNEEGFVPLVCCRPMFRRQSVKRTSDIDNAYQPHDFGPATPVRISCSNNQPKSPTASIPTLTPSLNKKFSLTTLASQSILGSSRTKRVDVASSCGGDSGFSDCESSSHHHLTFDQSRVRPFRSGKNQLVVHDTPTMRNGVNNRHLSVSTNSAFTQIVKKHADNTPQKSGLRQPLYTNTRLLHRQQQETTSSSTNLRSDETSNTSPLFKRGPSSVSSPYIRRTPFARRSLPHTQPIMKKFSCPMSSSSSSPDPFKTVKESQLRHVVLAEPSLPPAIFSSSTRSIERQFSDLSLNQIENDSLAPTTPSTPARLISNRPSLSYSSSSTSSSSSASSSTSSGDGHTPANAAFLHIQMNNSRIDVIRRAERLPLVFTTATNPTNNTTKPTSFIHNVSITV